MNADDDDTDEPAPTNSRTNQNSNRQSTTTRQHIPAQHTPIINNNNTMKLMLPLVAAFAVLGLAHAGALRGNNNNARIKSTQQTRAPTVFVSQTKTESRDKCAVLSVCSVYFRSSGEMMMTTRRDTF